jgi:hypothetical protein
MPKSAEPDEPVTLELPPLDLDEPEHDGPAQEIEHAIDVDERSAIDRDDEPAFDLDVGIELSDSGESSSEPGGDLVLDIGELLERSDDDEAEDGDPGALGPEHFDVTSGLSDTPNEPASSSAVEGTDEPLGDLVSEELPDLDADEEGVADANLEPDMVTLGMRHDEHEPALWAAERWSPVDLPAVRGARVSDLTVRDGRIFAVGDALWMIAEGGTRATRADLAGANVSTFVLLEREPLALLYATRDARLNLAEVGQNGIASCTQIGVPREGSLELMTAADRTALARNALGKLFRTHDAGRSWQPVDVGSRVLALARHGRPLVALAHGRARPCLLRSSDAGQSWQQVVLDEAAREVALGQSPLLGAAETLVALADARQGMVVSDDGGASFAPVARTFGATAIAVGTWEGRPRVWAALLGDLDGVTRLVMVDPQRAEAATIVELESQDDAEAFRVDALAWDAWNGRVWAGGAFGLLSFEPGRARGH